MYIKSVNDTLEDYRKFLLNVPARDLALKNTDCDTGRDTSPGEYPLTDDTYARLLDEHSKNDFAQLPADLRAKAGDRVQMRFADSGNTHPEASTDRNLVIAVLPNYGRVAAAVHHVD